MSLTAEQAIYFDDERGHGFLLTRLDMGVPECLVTFEYDPDRNGRRLVELVQIKNIPPLAEAPDHPNA